MEAALRLVELREAESLNQAEAKYRAVHARRNEIASSLQVRTQVGNDSGFSSMEELLSGSTFVTIPVVSGKSICIDPQGITGRTAVQCRDNVTSS